MFEHLKKEVGEIKFELLFYSKTTIGILGIDAIRSIIFTQLFEKKGIELLHFNRSKTEHIKLQFPIKKHSYSIDCQTVMK